MHIHTQASAHLSIFVIHNLIYGQVKWITMTSDGGRQQHGTKSMVLVGLLFLEKERNVSKFDLAVQRGFLSARKGKIKVSNA